MAPWPTDADIEQDLILSRLVVEIANNELLGNELTMRGGTCLHKLYLPAPLRYSEDLDYVRRTRSGIGPYMDALRTIATGVGLVEGGRTQVGQMVHMAFTADSTHGQRRLRIKIEMNIRETESCFPRTSRPYQVLSSWWSGRAGVNTFQLEELLGTKLRALYQRRKGRDLFDLWHFLTATSVTDERIVQAFHHYMREGAFTYPDLAANLSAKLSDQDFASDLSELVVAPPPNYDLAGAADLVMERLGSRLAKAPRLDEIAGGGWRSDARRP